MSEQNNMHSTAKYRRQLLTTVSAVALAAAVYAAGGACAADADRSVLWIEGGWHFEDVNGTTNPFVPPLNALVKQGGYTPLTSLENVLDYSYGGEGGISFQPEDSSWIFSASIRYGRSHGRRHVHQQKPGAEKRFYFYSPFKGGSELVTATVPTGYQEAGASNSETHAIIDFTAGKDVGLGLFGAHSTSTASFGVRFAQINSKLGANAHARPDGSFGQYAFNFIGIPKYVYAPVFHYSASSAQRDSNFRGIGPSLSWSNTTVLAGNVEDGELTLDWGVNAALLFGRQRTKVHVETKTTLHYDAEYYPIPSNTSKYVPRTAISTVHSVADKTRTRNVTVPNVGASLGMSWRLQNAKLSLGYRYDTFLNAINTGIDAAKKSNVSFNGPYASISIGLGD